MGFLESESVPKSQCDRMFGGRAEGCHVDVVLVAKYAGVENGGANMVVVEVGDWKVVGEVGRRRYVGVVGEFSRHEGVQHPVNYRW